MGEDAGQIQGAYANALQVSRLLTQVGLNGKVKAIISFTSADISSVSYTV